MPTVDLQCPSHAHVEDATCADEAAYEACPSYMQMQHSHSNANQGSAQADTLLLANAIVAV